MSTEAELTHSAMAFALAHCRTVAVVGLSPKTHRDSYEVAHYMQQHGWRIVPINPIDEAIAIGAKAIWLQMGIYHDAAAAKARAAGIPVVQNKCLMVEHARGN